VGESLAPAVKPLLEKLGVWDEFLAFKPVASFGTRSHWGEQMPRVHSHLMNPWGCGWHVDRQAFDRMLAEGACRAGAVPFFGATLAGCAPTQEGWRLALRARGAKSAGPTLSARILIDATGRAARCATQLGARRLAFDRLVAAAVRFENSNADSEGYVLVETTPCGWWYSAPIPGGGMIAMLMTDGDLCRPLGITSPRSWQACLRRAALTDARLSHARLLTAPRVFYAASHRLYRSASEHAWLAVGDAALAVDPISGSGIVRALRTAWAGAEAAFAVLETGSHDAICAYERERDLECTRYLQERADYYGLESRWADQPFWARRQPMQSAMNS
jgi:flavin-dependent dehydrogenase